MEETLPSCLRECYIRIAKLTKLVLQMKIFQQARNYLLLFLGHVLTN
ncbi:hypothetical protein HanPSC8_Chr08g0313861 [Helianthus annuus]|nr:hypothetical protein HanPSC8_Chr08g0313861 [Helianthus annuus]